MRTGDGVVEKIEPRDDRLAVPSISKKDIPKSGIGFHSLFDFYECREDVLDNIDLLSAMMREAAIACGAQIVNEDSHRFEPYGISCTLILAESHLSLHTWPEHQFAAVDLFSCSEKISPERAEAVLLRVLKPARKEIKHILRGLTKAH